MELVNSKFRSRAAFIFEIVWVIGYLYPGVLRMLIANWRWLYAAVASPAVLTFTFYWFVFILDNVDFRILPESPYWLASKGRQAELDR